MNKKEKPDYIDEWEEWNRNQFVAGHYTGGNIPPYIKYPGKPKRLALVFGIYTVLYIISLTLTATSTSGTMDVISIIIYIALSSIYLLAGISLLRKVKKK